MTSKALRSIRPLKAASLNGVEPAKIGKKLPKFELADPRMLYVEEAYQRGILARGTRLIREIVAEFSWSRFKPPICVRLRESGNLLVCIDGQHTATAAASHPDIRNIPIMVVDAADIPARAAAFVGHNRDRLALTTVMIYAAELAAGDEVAIMVNKACRAAGATIPRRMVASHEKQPVGQTISLGAIKAIAQRQGVEALTRVLRVLVAVGRAPIKSVEIAAVAMIFTHHPALDEKRLAMVIGQKTAEEWTGLGQVEASKSGKAIALGMVALWCDELGLDAPRSDVKGHATDHARLIKPTPPVKAAEPRAAPPLEPPKAAAPKPAAAKPSRLRAGPPSSRFTGLDPSHQNYPREDKSKLRNILAEAAANTAKLRPPPE